MPTQTQLEIIHPSGEYTFHALNQREGITNIGHHPDNDVVIPDAGFPPFCAVLDHRSLPHHVILLNEHETANLDGQIIPAYTPTPLPAGASLTVKGYILALVAGEGTGASTALSPTTTAAIAQAPTVLGMIPYFDQLDDFIYAEANSQSWDLLVEETATCQIKLGNAGALVATFMVNVQGIDPEWVSIFPPEVNLHEEEQAQVTVMITPPRQPQSRAGIHYLAIEVTSPDYPGRVARISGTLTVAPYYEFVVSPIKPVKQAISWRKRVAHAEFSITNKSNTPAEFQLSGEDDERQCFVEFEIQHNGREETLARQAKITIQPAQKLDVPVTITPPAPQIAGVRGRIHSLLFTTTLAGQDQTPHTLMTQVTSKPLVGPLVLILMGLCLALMVIYVARPRIHSFTVTPETVEAGQEVLLSWNVSPFVTDVTIEGLEQELTPAQQSVSVVPLGPATTYRLRANNLISRFLPFFGFEQRRTQTVIVIPAPPAINTFMTDKDYMTPEGTFTVKWSVSNANEIKLMLGDMQELIPLEESTGERTFTLLDDALLALEIRNSAGATLKSKFIKVISPTVQLFDVTPALITAGQSVTVTWRVSGSDTVAIAPLPDKYPASGSIPHQPAETTNYVLTLPAGNTEIKVVKSVVVIPQSITETIAGQAPVIEFFTATPAQVSDKGTAVQLAWSITGKVTNVAITSLDSFKGDKLKSQDIVTVSLKQATAFIITAANGPLSVSQVTEVTLAAPTAAEEAAAAAAAEEAAAAAAAPEIVFFKLVGAPGYEGDVLFQRQTTVENWPLYVYAVATGAKVLFTWETKNADIITINGETQPPAGEAPRVITANGVYRLIAKNSANGQEVDALLRTDVMASTHAPTPPACISPVDGALGVTLSPSLQWQATDPDGDALTYNVAFGASNPPGVIATGVTALTYSPPGPLSPSTTYYWSIAATDGSHVTQGAVCRFTTATPAPCTPVLVAPPDTSTGVALTPTLSWQCAAGSAPVTYAVALGATSGRLPIVASGLTTLSYTPPTLAPNTLYYWNVIATDGAGYSTSATWTFTTGN